MFRINSTFVVLLDACVLYPDRLRDLLITFSQVGLFRARCTDRIHDEWTTSLKANRPDIPVDAIARTRTLMDQAMEDWLIEGYEDLIESIELPDKNDRHVVAAAIRGRCDLIITLNIKHFPRAALEKLDIDVLPPDEFLAMQIDIDQPTFLRGQESAKSVQEPAADPAGIPRLSARTGSSPDGGSLGPMGRPDLNHWALNGATPNNGGGQAALSLPGRPPHGHEPNRTGRA